MPRICRTWIGVAIGGGVASAGIGAITSATSGGPKVSNTFLENPEYPHSQDARDLWWQTLQNQSTEPGYGAIQPDWNNIWDTVQNHIKQYYGGGPLAPGVQQGVSASLARRNMSDSPASDYLHAQVSGQEGVDLSNEATNQGVQQTNLEQQGQSNWLQSLENFQSQKPAGQWNTTVTPSVGAQIGGAIGSIGSSVASAGLQYAGAQQQQQWLNSLLSGSSGPQSYAPSIIGAAGPKGNALGF